MFEDKTVLGLIPARAGSKGIPGKNAKLLAGKPLIVYTIEAAKISNVFDCLMVSTDSEKIAFIARNAGAAVPFMRPAELATDTAKAIDVLQHAMFWLETQGQQFDWVMYLQPTSPLRGPVDILGACRLMKEKNAQAVVAVCEVEHHPWWSNTLPPDLSMASFVRPEAVNVQRQELPKYYRVNGAIYLAQWDFIRKGNSWFGPGTYAYIMPQERSVDVDSFLDFMLAETLIKLRMV